MLQRLRCAKVLQQPPIDAFKRYIAIAAEPLHAAGALSRCSSSIMVIDTALGRGSSASARHSDRPVRQGVQRAVRNQWRRWVKLEKLTSLSSQTSSTSIIIDPGGSWAISIKEKPGRRDQVTCLEVDQLLDRPTSNSLTI